MQVKAIMKVFPVAIAILAISAFVKGDDGQASIYGMQALRISCDTEDKFELVRKFENQHGFDFTKMSRDRNVPVDVFVAPERLEYFKQFLTFNNINYEIFIEDVGKLIDAQFAQQKLARLRNTDGNILDYFPRYDEITKYVKNLVKTYANITQLLSLGKTEEGREIIGVKISSGGSKKPAVYFDGGIHAREWISPTTVIYALKQIVENATNHYLFQNVDIYIVPSINPDGYEYSHNKTSTRMWRKNRHVSPNESCIGVDINRNFEYDWRPNDPCEESYSGKQPFSEPETKGLRNFILANKDVLKVYISFHSYGNCILHPWGAKAELPKGEPLLRCVATIAKGELAKIRGTEYIVGSTYNILYPLHGGSNDWILGTVGVDLSYIIELPSIRYHFLAPLEEILPVGRETFEAIKIFIQYADGKICQNV